jgi:uncharacterized RDD family membrane protein YckC
VTTIVAAERAGAVSRLGAFVVDAFILAIAVRTTAWMLGGVARVLGHLAPPVDLEYAVIALFPLWIALYLVVFWRVTGQTLGKWVLGLRVVTRDGGPLTMRHALVRLGGYVLSALPLYLGFLWILGPQRRGWHDRLASTQVVYLRRLAPTDAAKHNLRHRLREAQPAHS